MPFRTIDDYPGMFTQAVMNWMKSCGYAMDDHTVSDNLRQYYGEERSWPLGLQLEYDLLQREADRQQ